MVDPFVKTKKVLVWSIAEPLPGENRWKQGFGKPAIDVIADDCKIADSLATADELLSGRYSHAG